MRVQQRSDMSGGSGVRTAVREVPPLAVIDLAGEVTTFAADAMKSAYREAAGRTTRGVLLNFKEVEYINSSGISTVIGLLTEARNSDRELLICGLSEHYAKIFDIMGLTDFVSLFESEEAALRSVAQ